MRFNVALLCVWICLSPGLPAGAEPKQFILFNVSRAAAAEACAQIHRQFLSPPDAQVRVGVGGIFSYLSQPREQTIADLQNFLLLAQQTDTPVVIQLDGENWWDGRPDLWNWWDPQRPGYSPTNRWNVEWTGWSPENALKLAWRNWGQQIRVLPPPNLLSPTYREACHAEMRVLIPLVLHWWRMLPPAQRYLFVGLKLGWESSIGVNAWYYPNGNALVDQPVAHDPTNGIAAGNPPARGVTQIGYAAVKTAAIRRGGELSEADLAEVVRRHLDDLCRCAAELGVPREKLFTHIGGWKERELVYESGLNPFSCPGWSFYRHAADPRMDPGVQAALEKSDAPYWAAVEWLYQGPSETKPWQRALAATLSSSRCRYLCIYNWEGVRESSNILTAVQNMTATKGAGTN